MVMVAVGKVGWRAVRIERMVAPEVRMSSMRRREAGVIGAGECSAVGGVGCGVVAGALFGAGMRALWVCCAGVLGEDGAASGGGMRVSGVWEPAGMRAAGLIW